jgi:hypothetical protein
MLALGGATYAFGAPTIHLLHGNGSEGGYSAALRFLGLPLGAIVGCELDGGSSDDFGCFAGFVVGGLIGSLTAITLDATLLAYEDVPQNASTMRLTPWIDVTRHGTGVALAGAF